MEIPLRNGVSKPKLVRGNGYKMVNMGELFSNSRIYDIEMDRAPLTEKEKETSLVEVGDLLFARQSLVFSGAGKCSIIKEVCEPTTYESHLIRARINRDLASPDYMYYYFSSPQGRGRIQSIVEQVSAAGIRGSDLSKLGVSVPSLEIQKKIADILCCFDDKIELNNKINANLQQQAQTIFKSWFVDFEPFGGVKPNSWIVSTLGEVTEMSAGGDKPKNISCTKSAEFPYPIYSNGLEKEGLYGYTDKAKIFAESVTVSARGTIGFVCLRHIPYVPIVRLITLLPKGELLSAKYLYLFLKQSHISGTGTTQQQLTVPNFRKAEILIPDKAAMDEFTKIVAPMYTEIWINEDENIRLSLLRDALLPKLMSGEIDISGI